MNIAEKFGGGNFREAVCTLRVSSVLQKIAFDPRGN